MDVCCGNCREIYNRNNALCPACGSHDQSGVPVFPWDEPDNPAPKEDS